MIQNLKIKEDTTSKLEELINSSAKKHKAADKALEYLCWVVNADILFDFALRTYDFELVIMVAKHTQKDPKEYLPYLKRLKELDHYQMRYQINIDLKNYEDALTQLSKAGDKYFETCLELINKHELYELAFSLFQSDEKLFSAINHAYGQYLVSKKRHFEAGYALLRSEHLKDALKCFTVSFDLNSRMLEPSTKS